MDTNHRLPGAEATSGSERRYQVLAVIGAGTFMSTLDAGITGIAQPTIGQAFHADLTLVTWVSVAYALAITCFLLPMGRWADLAGHRKIYAVGIAWFTLASAGCAVAPSLTGLIAARALQGVGGAMLMAVGPAALTEAFGVRARGQALGSLGTVVAAGFTAGPVLGGLLVKYWGWRSVFLVNLPVGALVAPWAARVLPASRSRAVGAEGFDLVGALASGGGLAALLLGLNEGQASGWLAPTTIAGLGAGLLLLTGFLIWEARHPHPVLDLGLFRRREFAGAAAAATIAFVATSTTALLMPFFLQGVMGLRADHAGLLLLPLPLTVSIVAPISGWLSDRVGTHYLSSAGIAVMCGALLTLSTLAWLPTTGGVLWRMGLAGLGAGMFSAPNNSAIMGAVEAGKRGIAGGVMATARNLGISLGMPLAATAYAVRGAAYGDPPMSGAIATYNCVAAYHDAFLVAAVVCSAALVVTLLRGDNEKRPR